MIEETSSLIELDDVPPPIDLQFKRIMNKTIGYKNEIAESTVTIIKIGFLSLNLIIVVREITNAGPAKDSSVTAHIRNNGIVNITRMTDKLCVLNKSIFEAKV